MKTLTAILVFLALTFTAFSQTDWLRTYNSPNAPDAGVFTLSDNQGNIYVTGSSQDSILKTTTWKYSPQGSLIWVRTFSKPGNTYGTGHKILLNQNGDLFVFTWTLQNATTSDMYIIKYDASGNELAHARYGLPNEFDYFIDAAFDASGNIIVLVNGKTAPANTDVDIILLKFNQQCVVQYFQSFNIGTWDESAVKLLINNAGDIFVVGSRTFNSNTDILAVKYNSQLQYITYYTYAGYANQNDAAKSACLTPDGGLVIAGETRNTGVCDFTVIKLSQALTYEWMNARKFVTASTNEFATNVTVDNNGNIYATGSIYQNNAVASIMTVKYDNTGTIVWNRGYDRGNGYYNQARNIFIDLYGNVYVGGHSTTTSTHLDAMILKYNPNGTLGFEYNYNGIGFNSDEFYSMNVTPAGTITACGRTTVNATTYDTEMLLVKLTGVMTGISGYGNEIPDGFKLQQNYPNPFNPSTTISFSIPKASQVKLVVYDAAGREVETLVNENLNAGSFEVDFNASKLTSGVYFYKLVTEGFTDVKKMILVK